jgi:hypothetical protein
VLSLRKRKNHSLLGGNQDARHVKTAISLLGLFLLMHSLAFGADLFQWTDARGVIHFTDSFDSVPELVRQSASLIVRPGFFSPADQSKSRPSFPERLSATRPPEPNQDSQLIANDIGPAPMTYTPQEIIVGVNSDAQQQVKQLWCVGNKCNRAFRPRFNEPDLCAGVLSSLAPRRLCQVRQVRLLSGKETGVSSCCDSVT